MPEFQTLVCVGRRACEACACSDLAFSDCFELVENDGVDDIGRGR